MFGQAFDVDAALQLDAAIGNQFGSPDIDVVSGPAPQVLHEQTEMSRRDQEACLLETLCRNRRRAPLIALL